jgi:hypothetical protein
MSAREIGERRTGINEEGAVDPFLDKKEVAR